VGLVFIPLFITRAINHLQICPTQTAACLPACLPASSTAFSSLSWYYFFIKYFWQKNGARYI
jgi:hypothetical protein